MGFFSKLFGQAGTDASRPRKVATRAPVPRPAPSSIPPANLRRELLRLALRQSLSRNGIPVHWIGAEAIELPGPGNPLHVRLLVQHWDERLPTLFLAFQEDFEQRLLAVEPLAHTWLRGFSWQFQLVDATSHPSLPDPSTWWDGRDSAPAPLSRPAGLSSHPMPLSSRPMPLTSRPAPLMREREKPAAPAMSASDRKIKEELERLFAQQDADRAMGQRPDFEPTRQGNW